MRPFKELDHTEWLKRIFELGAAAIAIITAGAYIISYVVGLSAGIEQANARNAELRNDMYQQRSELVGRLDRQRDAIIDERKIVDIVNQRTARIEGMVSTLIKRGD